MRKKLYKVKSYCRNKGKILLLLGLFLGGLSSSQAQTLVWEENFNGSTIDPQTWTFDFGDGCERGICGWGNNELEYYTSRPENARLENGNLVIEARRENFQNKAFTSARLKTLGRLQFKYGTLEARIKVPNLANGLWPAFWMLGSTGNWPASGEIDILEMGSAAARQAGVTNKRVGAAVHWENNNSHAFYDRYYDSPTDLTSDYHVYKMSWDSRFIRMYIDNTEYYAIDISQAAAADLEEFHKSQFILLNLAVGGQYTGIPDAGGVTAPLPAQMLVDYIKLYQNPGDELFIGKNNAYAGDFGVYTEQPTITDKLAYGQNANLYLWNNLTPITSPAPVPFEGSEVLALRAAAGNWFGFGVETTPMNLLNFADGALKFNFKTSYTGQFKIGIKSGHGETWINYPAGSTQYGLVRDGQWHEVSIPLTAFQQPNAGMNLDLGSISQMFMFAGDAPSGAADFYIDNIYYSQKSTTIPPTNPEPGTYCATTSDYSFKAISEGSNVTFTFHPIGATAGGNLALIYIREGASGAYPGYNMVKNSAGDFTFTKSIPAGTETSVYFTYQVGAGGPERNSAATPHSYTVGTTCGANTENKAPTVSISAPANNATFTAPATIALTANAADADGTVNKVEFFNGTSKLGEDATAPYTYNWTNVAAGTYTITAKATDNTGAATTSDAITVMVNGGNTNPDGYNLVWADEFTNGISPDWVFETGRGSNGWGNNELQYYRRENAAVENGELVITAKKESFEGAEYTSARMKTQDRKDFKYGKIEAKIAMPSAKGLWPAFWMLGSNINTIGWPNCGEIDIMEHINDAPEVHGTIHWSSANGSYANYGGSTPADVTIAHVYTIEWDASAIKWFIDGKKYHEVNIAGGVNGTDEFHEKFFLLLNMAVGGNWPGFNVDNAAFPAKMYVDYVRVYQKETPYTGPTVRITAPANNSTATPGSTIAITANASDDVNTITKVEFFNGSTKLGEDTTAPYTFSIASAVTGTYTLTAKVTNNTNLTATSAPVTVVVKDNVITGDYFGIYTEQAAITNKLIYSQDANLWIWNNLANITPAPAAYEGNESLALRAAAGNWFGFGIDNEPKNLGSFANGALIFHFKTSSTAPFKLGMVSGGGESWIEFPAGLQKYGLIRDGQWHEVKIPFKEFAKLDLATLDQAFMFAGDAPSATADFYFDNIYFSSKAANTAPSVSIQSPENNAKLTAPATFIITAAASDADGTISKVEFFNGTSKLGEVTSAPYTYNWANVGAGTYTLTAKATDNAGATAISTAVTITVSYPDKDGDGYTSDKDCNDNDASIYPGATDLCDGIDRNCDGKVRTPMTVPAITVIPSSNVYTGGDAKTIYIGYGPQSVTLKATTSPAAVSYSWSPATGLSNATSASPVFTPKAAGSYTFTVTASNSSGCTASAPVMITVIDVRGGKKLDKVLVCHKGKVVELTSKEVPSHLNHGDKLGTCGKTSNAAFIAGNAEQGPETPKLSVYPNPTQDKTTIQFTIEKAGKYNLSVYGIRGNLIETIASGTAENQQVLSFDFDTDKQAKGIYLIKLVTQNGVQTQRLSVQ